MSTALIDQETGVPFDTFAARLMIVRAALGGLNIKQAAIMCGVSPESWRQWEHGAKPRDYMEICRSISEHTGVSELWLAMGGSLRTPTRSPWMDFPGRSAVTVRPGARRAGHRPPRPDRRRPTGLRPHLPRRSLKMSLSA